MSHHHLFPQGSTVLAVGTKRGLFLLHSQDRGKWNVEPVSLKGRRIFHAILDQRNGQRLFAAENGDFFGSFLHYSDDFGVTWHKPQSGIQFPEGSGKKLTNIWVIEPGRANEPGVVYAGVDPASLWVSSDSDVTCELNAALANHPTRERWEPCAGGLYLH